MIATTLPILGAIASTSDARQTIGCMAYVLVPILIACLHYQQQRIAEDGDLLARSDRNHNRNHNNNLNPNDNQDDNDNLGFGYYHDRDEEEELLRQEVVEITFDLGNMEGDVRRFLSRMYRVMI